MLMNVQLGFTLVLSFKAVIILMVAMLVTVSKDISQKTVTYVTMLMNVLMKLAAAEIIATKMQIVLIMMAHIAVLVKMDSLVMVKHVLIPTNVLMVLTHVASLQIVLTEMVILLVNVLMDILVMVPIVKTRTSARPIATTVPAALATVSILLEVLNVHVLRASKALVSIATISTNVLKEPITAWNIKNAKTTVAAMLVTAMTVTL